MQCYYFYKPFAFCVFISLPSFQISFSVQNGCSGERKSFPAFIYMYIMYIDMYQNQNYDHPVCKALRNFLLKRIQDISVLGWSRRVVVVLLCVWISRIERLSSSVVGRRTVGQREYISLA